MIKQKIKIIDILLVEDNPADIDLTMEAFEECKFAHNLHVVSDGERALSFLRKERNFNDKPRPDLILLDLNLPKIDGREVLAEIKSDDKLKQIPVVILTTSESKEDIIEMYKLHANCYITKPVVINQFTKVVQTIGDFWFSIVKLPLES